MRNKFSCTFVIFQVLILSLTSTCSGQDNHANLNSLVSNVPTPAIPNSNHSGEHNVLNKDVEHSNDNTHIQRKLDKVFGVDIKIFEEYLKDEDLRIIPGLRDDDDFDNWSPPPDLRRDIPAYMSGFDYQDRPIWVVEFGKWRLDSYALTTDKEKIVLFEKYMRYLGYTMLKSQALRSTKERRVKDFVALCDYGGLLPEYLTNRRVIRFLVKVFSHYKKYSEKYSAKSIVINVNPIIEIFLNLLRPFYNRSLGRIEVYGTNKYIWVPKILKSFPKDQIPEWYGGNKGYEPFNNFG